MQRKAGIYALLEPSSRKVRYIGQSLCPARRAWEHWQHRNNDDYLRNPAFADWLRSLDGPPGVHVFEEVSFEDRFKAEEYYTDLLRQIPGVELLNINSGAKQAESVRKKISARHVGVPKSAEHRAAMSAAARAYTATLSPEERAKLGGIKPGMFTGRKHSTETREKMKAAQRLRRERERTIYPEDVFDE